MNPHPVRFATVSPGRWGRKLLDAAKASPHLQFAGVSSRDPAKAVEIATAYGGNTYPSYEALLADPAVEAVVVATPHFLHHPQTLAALRAGPEPPTPPAGPPGRPAPQLRYPAQWRRRR